MKKVIPRQMRNIPILGRLSLADYVRIILAFSFLLLEPILRILFAILPLCWVSDTLRKQLERLIGPPQENEGNLGLTLKEQQTFLQFRSTEDFVNHWGFPFQTHFLTTKDGYILSLHRIPFSRSELAQKRANAHFKSYPTLEPTSRPVVLFWHGFLMCSEVWVSAPNFNENLAYTLADAGYDVWLGNTRGNKYSCKHRTMKPTEESFWDFSLDHLATYDLSDSVNYIMKTTGVPTLSYIGFSQGSAQGFAGLSMDAELGKKINLFIALAPATKPRGLESKGIHSLVNASPELIFLLFGRKSLLSSCLFWQNMFSPATFSWVIDVCMWGLFDWNSEFMHHKQIIYRHLYSYTSVKCVVHWFQIMKSGTFQMFDDSPSVLPGNQQSGYHVPRFPTNQIQTPIALFYGGKDTLPDMKYILKNIRKPVFCLQVQGIERLIRI
jgi:lysosomal acid lipase/cholesteryl ester hydrolase